MKKITLFSYVLLLNAICFCQSKNVFSCNIALSPAGFSSAYIKDATSTSAVSPDARLSFGAGVEFDLNFSKIARLSIKPSLNSLAYKNGSTKVRVQYLDIPAIIEFKFKKSHLMGYAGNYIIGAGPYLGLTLGGNFKSSTKVKMNFGEGATDNRSATDMGIHTLLGFEWNDGVKSFINLMFGTKNVIPKNRQINDASIKLNNLSWTIALPLKIFTKK